MRILRPHTADIERAARAARSTSGVHRAATLRCRVRLADGRLYSGALPAPQHRAIQLSMLHAHTLELVEITPGSRAPDAAVEIDRRRRREHYLPGGASGDPRWLATLLEHAERIAAGEYATRRFGGQPREEAFVGVAPRMRPRGNKNAIVGTRFLWVDVDRPGQLPALWAFLAERPCHLLIESGGSGGVHAYWKLDALLPATLPGPDGPTEPIEQAHLRIIHRLGRGANGEPNVADPACKERARLMRLAGTINYKSGQYARVVEADFQLAGYALAELVGDLPDPAPPARDPAMSRRRSGDHADPYKRIAPPEYFGRLAGIAVSTGGGQVSCPVPEHADGHPLCSVGAEPSQGWCCHSGNCGARGAIYDLASVLLGGPHGRDLRGDAFRRARDHVRQVFGDVVRGEDAARGAQA